MAALQAQAARDADREAVALQTEERPKQSRKAARPPAKKEPLPSVQQTTTITVKQQESVVFAVITLLFYIFVYPVGALLNLIGLITGPNRGCFVSMLIFFLVLPAAAIAVLFMIGIDVFEAIGDFFSGIF